MAATALCCVSYSLEPDVANLVTLSSAGFLFASGERRYVATSLQGRFHANRQHLPWQGQTLLGDAFLADDEKRTDTGEAAHSQPYRLTDAPSPPLAEMLSVFRRSTWLQQPVADKAVAADRQADNKRLTGTTEVGAVVCDWRNDYVDVGLIQLHDRPETAAEWYTEAEVVDYMVALMKSTWEPDWTPARVLVHTPACLRGVAGEGPIAGTIVEVRSVQVKGGSHNWHFLVLLEAGYRVLPGQSGSAVTLKSDGRPIGMLVARFEDDHAVALVTPLHHIYASLNSALPEQKKLLLCRQCPVTVEAPRHSTKQLANQSVLCTVDREPYRLRLRTNRPPLQACCQLHTDEASERYWHTVDPLAAFHPSTVPQSCRFWAPSNPPPHRIALCIGNAAYPTSPLANPINDVTDFGSYLRARLDFTVNVLCDASKQAMEDALKRLLADIQPGTVVVLFFAGHGCEVDGVNYLMPIVDGDAMSNFDLRYKSVSAQWMQAKVLERKPALLLFIIDAARHNPYRGEGSVSGGGGQAVIGGGGQAVSVPSARFRNFPASREVTALTRPLGTLLLFACAPGMVSLDGVGRRNSPLTTHLMQHLHSGEIHVAMRRVIRAVVEATNERQNPQMHSDLKGDFYWDAAEAEDEQPPHRSLPTGFQSTPHFTSQLPRLIPTQQLDFSRVGASTQSAPASASVEVSAAELLAASSEHYVARLVALMKEQSSVASVQQRACALLAAAAYDEHTHDEMQSSGAIECIVAAMQSHPADARIQQSGCEALLRLARANGATRWYIVLVDGAECVVSAVRSHSARHAAIKESGLSALIEFARDEAAYRRIVALGGLQLFEGSGTTISEQHRTGWLGAVRDMFSRASRAVSGALTGATEAPQSGGPVPAADAEQAPAPPLSPHTELVSPATATSLDGPGYPADPLYANISTHLSAPSDVTWYPLAKLLLPDLVKPAQPAHSATNCLWAYPQLVCGWWVQPSCHKVSRLTLNAYRHARWKALTAALQSTETVVPVCLLV